MTSRRMGIIWSFPRLSVVNQQFHWYNYQWSHFFYYRVCIYPVYLYYNTSRPDKIHSFFSFCCFSRRKTRVCTQLWYYWNWFRQNWTVPKNIVVTCTRVITAQLLSSLSFRMRSAVRLFAALRLKNKSIKSRMNMLPISLKRND